jgi:hypothetical protein
VAHRLFRKKRFPTRLTGKKYDFYNKPYGMLHWLTHADYEHADIVALIDPGE